MQVIVAKGEAMLQLTGFTNRTLHGGLLVKLFANQPIQGVAGCGPK